MILFCASAAFASSASLHNKPNIVLFLTDDQDQILGGSFPPNAPNGATPMPQTKHLMADQGATAANFFIHTPICCPSRSELLSGRYFHNIKTNPRGTLPVGSDDCMHVNETHVNKATFARRLSEEAGYSVGMFGKYLNNVPKVPVCLDPPPVSRRPERCVQIPPFLIDDGIGRRYLPALMPGWPTEGEPTSHPLSPRKILISLASRSPFFLSETTSPLRIALS
jgi:hypothetical protein